MWRLAYSCSRYTERRVEKMHIFTHIHRTECCHISSKSARQISIVHVQRFFVSIHCMWSSAMCIENPSPFFFIAMYRNKIALNQITFFLSAQDHQDMKCHSKKSSHITKIVILQQDVQCTPLFRNIIWKWRIFQVTDSMMIIRSSIDILTFTKRKG